MSRTSSSTTTDCVASSRSRVRCCWGSRRSASPPSAVAAALAEPGAATRRWSVPSPRRTAARLAITALAFALAACASPPRDDAPTAGTPATEAPHPGRGADTALAAADRLALAGDLRSAGTQLAGATPSFARAAAGGDVEPALQAAARLEGFGDPAAARELLAQVSAAVPANAEVARNRVALASGQAELALGNLTEAESAIEPAARELDRAEDAPPRVHAQAAHALARLRNAQGKPDEAAVLASRAVATFTFEKGADAPATLRSRTVRAAAAYQAGRYADAIDELTDVLARQRAAVALPGDRLATESALAAALSAAGRLRDAIGLLRDVYDEGRRSLGPASPLALLAAYNLAAELMNLGEAAEAQRVVDTTLPATSAVMSPSHPDVMQLRDLAMPIDHALGRPDAALAAQEAVYRDSAASLGPSHPQTILRLRNLGVAYDHLGRSEEALALFADAARRQEQVSGPTHPYALIYRSDQATVLRDLGRLDEARAILARVLDAQRRTLGARHPDTLRTMDTLAILMREQGDAAAAVELSREVVEGRTDALGADHRDTLYSRSNLALAELADGHVTEALASATAAVEGFRRIGLARSYDAQMALLALVDVQVAAGDTAAAIASLETLVATVESLRASPELSPENRQALLARAAPGYKRLATLRAVHGQVARAFDASELAKGRTLLESLTTRRADESALLVPADRERLASLALRAERLVDAIAAAPDVEARVALEGERNAALREWAALRATLLRANPRYAALAEVRLANARDGAAALPRDAVFVSYVVGPERLVAFTLGRGAPLRAYDLGPSAPLESAVQAWRALTTAPNEARIWRLPDGRYAEQLARPAGATRVTDADEIARELARRLLVPLRGLDAPRWIVSPDGPLAFLPIEALPWHGRLVIDTKTVGYAQSLSTYRLARERTIATPSTRKSLLAVGMADYRRADGRSEWTPLPGSQAELDALEHIVPAGMRDVLRGADASESRLVAMNRDGALAGYRWLLFSTHGRLDPERPARSAIVLSQSANPPGVDGYVTAAEWPLYALDADLVVLSACETGLGRIVQGEGVTGLAYALFVAGTRDSMLSLWAVEDTSTATLVAAVFREIVAGRSHADALARAKRALRHDPRFRSPFFWAPFVVYGA